MHFYVPQRMNRTDLIVGPIFSLGILNSILFISLCDFLCVHQSHMWICGLPYGNRDANWDMSTYDTVVRINWHSPSSYEDWDSSS